MCLRLRCMEWYDVFVFAKYVRMLQYLPKPPRIAANEWKKYVKIFNVQNAYMDFESISESVTRTGLILLLKDNKDLIAYVTQNGSNWFFVNLQQELSRPVGIYQHWMNACRNCLISKPSSWHSCLQTGLFTNLGRPFLLTGLYTSTRMYMRDCNMCGI